MDIIYFILRYYLFNYISGALFKYTFTTLAVAKKIFPDEKHCFASALHLRLTKITCILK